MVIQIDIQAVCAAVWQKSNCTFVCMSCDILCNNIYVCEDLLFIICKYIFSLCGITDTKPLWDHL